MPRDTTVGTVMTADVTAFGPNDNVDEAMRKMVDVGVDGAPVVDSDGKVVGVITTGDLIVRESKVHFPTVISVLGATLEWPGEKKHFDEDLERALGADVREVMSAEPVTVRVDQTVEDAATLMHDHDVSRLPVVDGDGKLAGIIGRTDVLRVLVTDIRSEGQS
jgi:CBS domain-containing protein